MCSWKDGVCYDLVSWHGHRDCCTLNFFCLYFLCFYDKTPLVSPNAPPLFSDLYCLTQLQVRGTRDLNTDSFKIVCVQHRQRACATSFLGKSPEEKWQLQVCGYSKRDLLMSPNVPDPWVLQCIWKYCWCYCNFAEFIAVPGPGRRLTSGSSLTSGIHEQTPEGGPTHAFWERTGLRFKGFLWTASHYTKGQQAETTTQPERWIFIQSQTLLHSTPRWAHQSCSSRQNTVSQ